MSEIKDHTHISPLSLMDISIKELLDRYPQLIEMFIDWGFLCVGCPTEAFHALTDVVKKYRIDQDQLLKRIQKAIGEEGISMILSPQEDEDRRSS